VPYDHLISIGFLNERPDGRKHGDAFDAVVCGNTGSVHPVADLVEDIVSAKSGVSAAFRRALSSSRNGSREGRNFGHAHTVRVAGKTG
jgi:hypothetical protein